MINNTTKPLLLLGSNSNILKLAELAEEVGYTVAGIIDDDFYPNPYHTIPTVGREQDLVDFPEKYNNFQFVVATNWVPDDYEIAERNREKRQRQMALLDSLGFDVATIIGPLASVSQFTEIGRGVIIDNFAMVEPNVTLDDYVNVYAYAVIGHDSKIGRNTIIQRYCLVTSIVIIEPNTYLGLCSKVTRSGVTLASGTFLHPNLMLMRDTHPNEVVSLAGKDLRKVYQPTEVQ